MTRLDHRHERQQWHRPGHRGLHVAANTSTSPRTGTLTIAGETVTVTQAGALQLHASRRRRKRAGGGRVALGGGHHDERLRLDRREQRHVVDLRHRRQQWHRHRHRTYTVAANTSTSPRTGTLTIAGQTVTVTQAGVCNLHGRADDAKRARGRRVESAAVTTTERLRLDRREQ